MSPVSTQPRRDRMEPLWDRVDRNRLKLVALVALFVVGSAVGLDALMSIPLGMLAFRYGQTAHQMSRIFWTGIGVTTSVVSVISISWAVFTLLRSEKWLLVRFEAELVPTGELLDTKFALKDMAIAAGLPVAPALYRVPTWTTNAFVFSARRRRAVVGVTDGFLEKLTVDEQRAVFANLVARLVSGDTIVSTGLAALMWPVQAWRSSRKTADDAIFAPVTRDEVTTGAFDNGSDGSGAALMLVFGMGFAVLAEVIAAGQRFTQRSSAEKADAEGMLLLKDPSAMLSALRRCIALDNAVPSAGEMLSELFYCWTGFASDDDDDPEWARVARLREVLGVMGYSADEQVRVEDAAVEVPFAPRIDEADGS